MRRHAWHIKKSKEDKNEIEIEKRERNFEKKKKYHMDVPTTMGVGKVEEIKIQKTAVSVRCVPNDSRSKKKNFLLRFFYRRSVFTN